MLINYNTDTDVNETTFEDLKEYQEITDPELVKELMGEPIILNRYKGSEQFDYLFNHTIDVAALCWGNRDDKGIKLQRTPIRFKVDIEEPVTRVLPLNKFMISLAFLRCVIRYIDSINIDDFIITHFTKGAGVDISEVNKLVKQFDQARKLMKQFGGQLKGKKRGGFKLPFGGGGLF